MQRHTDRGYSVHSAKTMTSLELLGGYRQNEKQTERERESGKERRGAVEKEKSKRHMREFV